jgi:hypothetical protein
MGMPGRSLTTLVIRNSVRSEYGAGDHEQVGRSLLECRPSLVDAPDDADNLDVGAHGQRGPHRLLVDARV